MLYMCACVCMGIGREVILCSGLTNLNGVCIMESTVTGNPEESPPGAYDP